MKKREIKFRAWIKKQKRMHYLVNGEISKSDLVEEYNWKLMQYTGLKDKNGKEIYEGDIIEYKKPWVDELPMEDTHTVEFREATFWLGLFTIHEVYFPDGDIKTEIIGNIYEDKKLLK